MNPVEPSTWWWGRKKHPIGMPSIDTVGKPTLGYKTRTKNKKSDNIS